MLNKPTTGRPQKKRVFRWGKLVVLALLVLAVIQLGGKIERYQALQAELAIYEAQLATTQAAYDERLQTVSLLENDAYLERLARENLGMVKEGEQVVSIVKVDPPALSLPDETADSANNE